MGSLPEVNAILGALVTPTGVVRGSLYQRLSHDFHTSLHSRISGSSLFALLLSRHCMRTDVQGCTPCWRCSRCYAAVQLARVGRAFHPAFPPKLWLTLIVLPLGPYCSHYVQGKCSVRVLLASSPASTSQGYMPWAEDHASKA